MKTLRDLRIGDLFTVGKGKTVWVKETEQGIDNNYSYCKSLYPIQTKNPRKTHWDRLFNQNIEVKPQ